MIFEAGHRSLRLHRMKKRTTHSAATPKESVTRNFPREKPLVEAALTTSEPGV